MSSTFHNTNIAKISTNLKYYDSCCCSLKIKEKLDHILVMGLHTKEAPKSITICLYNDLQNGSFHTKLLFIQYDMYFQVLITNFFFKIILYFQQNYMGKLCVFCIKVQSILGIDDPINIHELLVWKPLSKLFNETGTYNWTLQFHFLNKRPIITSAHSQDPCWRALVMDLVSLTLEVKNSILNVGGCINPSS